MEGKGRTWAIDVGLHLGCGHGALQDQEYEWGTRFLRLYDTSGIAYVHTRVWYESSLNC
jgi:hypothetical protein